MFLTRRDSLNNLSDWVYWLLLQFDACICSFKICRNMQPVCLICLFLFFSRFIDIDIDKAMQRVLKRHISTGIYHVLFHNSIIYISSLHTGKPFWIYIVFSFPFPSIGKPPDIAKQRVKFTPYNLWCLFVILIMCPVEYWLNIGSIVFMQHLHNPDREQRQTQCRTYNEVQEKCWYNNQVSWFLRNPFVPSQNSYFWWS